MYTYRPADVFRVSDSMRYEVHTLPGDAGRYLVADDFYADPMAVRNLLLTTPFPIWERDQSDGNGVDYFDCRQQLQHIGFAFIYIEESSQ